MSCFLSSAGIIINEILTREKPYAIQLDKQHLSPEAIYKQVCEQDLRPHMQPPGQDGFTAGMNSIVVDCLQKNAFARPSFATIGVMTIVIKKNSSSQRKLVTFSLNNSIEWKNWIRIFAPLILLWIIWLSW